MRQTHKQQIYVSSHCCCCVEICVRVVRAPSKSANRVVLGFDLARTYRDDDEHRASTIKQHSHMINTLLLLLAGTIISLNIAVFVSLFIESQH